MAEFTKLLIDMIADTAEARAARLDRLVSSGMNDAAAILFDDAAKEAVERCTAAIGAVIDALPENNPSADKVNALLYVMRLVVKNMDALEDVLSESAIGEALLAGIPIAGIPIAQARGGNPDCPCPTCTAVREANAAALAGQTRH